MNISILLFFINLITIIAILINLFLLVSYFSGKPFSIYGNCNLNIFLFYNDTSLNIELHENSKKSDCVCHKGYITYIDNSFQTIIKNEEPLKNISDEIVQCCYKQKSQFTALMLETFLIFGFGHLYLGNYYLGFGKMIILSILTLLFCFGVFIVCSQEIEDNKNKINNKSYSKIFYFIIIIFFMFISLYFIDLCLMGFGFHSDKFGQSLKMW